MISLDMNEIATLYLANIPAYPAPALAGWQAGPAAIKGYVEPPLKVESGNSKPPAETGNAGAGIWLIAAPGAVGKSAFARELCARTGAIYIDLAEAAAIGGNYITGGAVNAGLFPFYQNGTLALVIDALDESFLNATTVTEQAFFNDVIQTASQEKYPILLLGRSIAIDLAEILLQEAGADPIRLRIDYFTPEQSRKFVCQHVAMKLTGSPEGHIAHAAKLEERVQEMLNALEEASRDQAGSFAGYAPVLETIADFFCEERNFGQSLIDSVGIPEKQILEKICHKILEREQKDKLLKEVHRNINSDIELYNPEDQMTALGDLYAGKPLKDIAFPVSGGTPAQQRLALDKARQFIEQHPFLGEDNRPANAVFAGAIQAFCLRRLPAAGKGLFERLPVSPLLAYFYFHACPVHGAAATPENVPIRDLPLLLESLRAFLPDQYELICEMRENRENDIDEEVSRLDKTSEEETPVASFYDQRRSTPPVPAYPSLFHARGMSRSGNNLYRQPGICDPGRRKYKRADVDFRCQTLTIGANVDCLLQAEIIAQHPAEINAYGSNMPFVCWPDSRAWPWSHCQQMEALAEIADEGVRQGALAFCRMALYFSTNRRDGLARLADKIECRTERNEARCMRDDLVNKGVLKKKGHLYVMNQSRLSQEYDMNFDSIRKRRISDRLGKILREILA